MHKIYENDDLMMYFKKRYCHCCGKVLQIKKTKRIVKKGDPDHGIYCTIGAKYKPYGDILVVGKQYYCPSCNKSFSCDEQGKIIEAQKFYKRKIVFSEEINNVYDKNMLISIKQINKLRWILLFPIVGGIICMYYIFNSRLREKTNSKDGSKLLLSSIIVLIGVAFIIKIVLFIFKRIEFLDDYKNLIMLVPSLLSFNLPILWYMNHKFRQN